MRNLSVIGIKSFASPQLITNPQTLKKMEGITIWQQNFKKHKNASLVWDGVCNNIPHNA